MNNFENSLKEAKLNSKLANNGIKEPLKDIILNHGSRGGIDGNIQPISRARCDFGRGFYLGDSDMQAKSLVVTDATPWFYKIKLHLSEANPEKVLVLNNKEWLYMVLAHRQLSSEFNQLDLARKMIEMANQYDIIIGPIADDRMNEAIQSFNDYALSDRGLYECLKYVDYGNQYVLKTNSACRLAEIIDEKPLRGLELDHIRKYADSERSKAKDVVKNAISKFRHEGMFLDEIIKEERIKEVNKGVR